MSKPLVSYLEKIKNLPGNNRSLLLLDLPNDYFLDLKKLDEPRSDSSFGIIKSIIAGEELIKITSQDLTDQELYQQLTRISSNENLIFEERGGKDLYVGWPFVRGKLNDGTLVRCPFVFFPFSLLQKDSEWYLQKRSDVNITLNKTFLLRYAYHNTISLSEDLIEIILNDFDTDSTLFRSQLYSLLKDSELEIEFNQHNFIDELELFRPFEKEQLEKNEENGKLKLYPYAAVGIFPQAGAYLLSDYEKLINLEGKPVSAKPKNEPISEVSPQDVRHADLMTPFRVDGYQELILRNVKSGNSVRVKGPPGSGKSQLISNLISDAMAHGKSVLLVSQKAAALTRVFKQLQGLQLHGFVGLVPDFKNDRKSIYKQIINQIENLSDYKQKNLSIDSEDLSTAFTKACESIEEVTGKLNEFKEALFDRSECGRSVKELYLLSENTGDVLPLNQVYRQFTFDIVDEFVPRLARYMTYHRRFEAGDHFWAMGPSLSHSKKMEPEQFQKTLDEIYAFDIYLKTESRKFTRREIDFETALFFLNNREPLDQLADNLKNESTYGFYIHMVDNPPDQDIGWLSQKERNLLQCFKGAGPEVSLPSNELGRFQEALEHAIKARKGIFSWIRWKLFSEDKIFITRVLVANDLKSNRSGFETLLERIDNRLNFEHFISELKEVRWLKDFPDSYRKIDIQNWFFYQKLALKSFYLRENVRTLPDYLLAKDETLGNYTGTINKLLDLIDQIPKHLDKWSKYVNEAQVRYLLLGKVDRKKIEKQIHEDLEDILVYHELRDSFNQDQQKLIDDLTALESEGKGDAENLFLKSISNAWIDHIEQKYPILRIASSQEIENHVENLQTALDEKLRLVADMVLLKVRSRAISATEKEGVEASYEELSKLLSDPAKKYPIRRVISQFEEEIFSLLPCWITTPESASAIFPMKEIFDLVIFDESGLCLAERGIPALKRSKNRVVFGDDQQLSSINIYGEESIHQNKAQETIYDYVSESMITLELRRNYSVKDLKLISFASKNFYGGKLANIPDFRIKADHGISLNRINGTWSKRGNQEEAIEIVEKIKSLVKKSPRESIGVIVFNSTQRAEILNLLAEKKIRHAESILVKTINTVQGEIFDQVIIGLTYSSWGQFGSVEPGLVNVLSTRARRIIHIYCSVDTDLDQSDPGLKLMNAFLRHATTESDDSSKNDIDTASLGAFIKRESPHQDIFEKDLPFADCAVYKNKAFHGVVLTDDQLKDQSVTDVFYNNYNLLREKKWPFIQFFSREFWDQKKASFNKLDRFIKREI